MATRTTSIRDGAYPAIGVAVRLGLLWQAAFSVAMLMRYLRHGTSFYLPHIGGAWPYAHQHLLWIAALVALGLGGRRLGGVLAMAAAFLAGVQVVTLADSGGPVDAVLSAAGVACIGVLPALALVLVPGARLALERRPDWLSSGVVAALLLSLCGDGVRVGQSSVLMVGPPQQTSVLRVTWLLWVGCILVLIWRGVHHHSWRLAALASTAHLLVVQVLWLASDAAIRSRMLGLPGRPPLEGVLRSAVLIAMLLAIHGSARARIAVPRVSRPLGRRHRGGRRQAGRIPRATGAPSQ
jgi:hypothetical protein